MQHLATLSSKNQITIPSAIRKSMDLSSGDRITFTFTGNHVVVDKAKNFMDFSGAFHHLVPTKPFSPKTIEKRMREFKKLEYEQKNQATG